MVLQHKFNNLIINKMKKKMIFWDNDFDRMFDEAVEELEKNQENNENNA